MHPSLLPKYRGAAPIQHALLDGAKTTGVSIIEMEDGKGFDFGDIWAQETFVRYVFAPARDNISHLE